jgi:hypothetical protein
VTSALKLLNDKDVLVVITGSIYVVGEALQALQA